MGQLAPTVSATLRDAHCRQDEGWPQVSPHPKPMIERLLPKLKARMLTDGTRKRASRRGVRRDGLGVPERLGPVAILIVEARRAIAFDGTIMQVERRLPAATGDPHADVVLMRAYEGQDGRQLPYVRAIQVRSLERLIAGGRIGVAGHEHDPDRDVEDTRECRSAPQ